MVRFTEDLSGCYTHKQKGDIVLHPINDDPYNVASAYLQALKERGEFDEDDMNCKELLICLHSFYYGGFRTAMECASISSRRSSRATSSASRKSTR